jgi:hypothetical protein
MDAPLLEGLISIFQENVQESNWRPYEWLDKALLSVDISAYTMKENNVKGIIMKTILLCKIRYR